MVKPTQKLDRRAGPLPSNSLSRARVDSCRPETVRSLLRLENVRHVKQGSQRAPVARREPVQSPEHRGDGRIQIRDLLIRARERHARIAPIPARDEAACSRVPGVALRILPYAIRSRIIRQSSPPPRVSRTPPTHEAALTLDSSAASDKPSRFPGSARIGPAGCGPPKVSPQLKHNRLHFLLSRPRDRVIGAFRALE